VLLRIDPRHVVPLACGGLAVLLTVLALVPMLRPVGWDVTALTRVSNPGTPMGDRAKAIDPSFHTVSNAYDGQFYWGIAIDPLAQGYIHQRFDDASYRYGHPLLGWLGWLFSGDTSRAVPAALLAICLASMFAAGWAAARLGQLFGGSGWQGLFVALNPGLLFAATHDLTEPLSAALMFGGVIAYLRGRQWLAAILLALLVLSKEQYALVPAGLALWDLLRVRRGAAHAAILASSILPAALWWIYAHHQLGHWFLDGKGNVGVPLSGWRRTLVDAGVWSYVRDYYQFLTGETILVIVVPLLALLTIAGLRALRFRTPVDVVYVLLGALGVCLAWRATYILVDALRNVSLLVALIPFVLATSAPALRPAPAPSAD
jgi:uncharacterized membrane protein (UPF0136 family)